MESKKNVINYYAPIIIPTLCRYEHLKRCLESLAINNGAESTDVFIALDYPSKEKQWDGYKKIESYLSNNKLNFRSLHVIKREENFGPVKNLRALKGYVYSLYDRLILSEDDNEFAPGFLNFINQGLLLYENDEKVNAICGYNYNINIPNIKCSSYFSYEYSAWGVGRWREKDIKIMNLCNQEYIASVLSSYRSMFVLYKNESRLLNTLIYLHKSNQVYGDTINVTYQYLNGMMSLFPKKSLVRNHGFDMSGSTINKIDTSYTNQEIDMEECHNDLEKITIEVNHNAMKYVRSFHKRPLWMNIAIFVRILWLKWFNKDLFYYYDIKRHKGVVCFKG